MQFTSHIYKLVWADFSRYEKSNICIAISSYPVVFTETSSIRYGVKSRTDYYMSVFSNKEWVMDVVCKYNFEETAFEFPNKTMIVSKRYALFGSNFISSDISIHTL